jgi:beta-galactosidase
MQDGKELAVDQVRTAGPAAKIRLIPDRDQIDDDGQDLSFITVRIEDRNGNLCPQADNLVHFDLAGPGTIAGVDNGNSATVEPFQADHRKSFQGMALLILRSKKDQRGQIQVRATSPGLIGGQATIMAKD